MKMLIILLQDFSAMKTFVFIHGAFLEGFEPHIITHIVVNDQASTNKTLKLGYTAVCITIITVSHDCI
jgi:hypothetical protein